MADAAVTEDVVLSNTGEQKERFSLVEEEVCDPLPLSLLRYCDASKSRAADCEKFIREELEDERVKCVTTEAQRLEPAMNEDDGKNMCGCELEKTQEQSRLREREFQEELRRLTEVEKLQQVELQLMAKRAQEKLEQQCLLQQVLMHNLKKRVEQERKMRHEEQKKMKEEQQRRKKVKEEKRKKEKEERRKREEEQMEKKNPEEEMRRKKEEEARRKGKVRNKDEEEKRKKEEEERREKDEKEKWKREGDREKNDRKKRGEEEEERKTKDQSGKIMKEEEGKNEKIEKVKKEEMERRNKEQEKRKTQEERINKEVENVKKKEEEKKNRQIVERIRPQEERKEKEEEGKQGDKGEKVKKEERQREKEEVERKNEEEEEKKRRSLKEEGKKRDKENVTKKKKEEEEQKGKDINQKEMEDEGRKKEEKSKMEEAAQSKGGGEGDGNAREDTQPVPGRQGKEGRGNHDEDKKDTQEEDGQVHEDGLHEETEVERHLDLSRSHTTGGDGPARPSTADSASRTTEHKRLAWVEDCVSRSKVSLLNRRKQRGCGPSGRRSRTAEDAGILAPLPPGALLQDTGWKTLKEVTTVNLSDVSGRSFSILSRCGCLRSLTLRRCGLTALEDLHLLPELCYVDVQENEISSVDCGHMTRLRVLRLGHNKLTSIHGLRGAENLDVLHLSHNSISRIAGLESMRRLQRLSVDHNQLISTKGLRDVSTLLHLNCSHNHLAGVEGLDNCVLLRTLDLRSNSLSQPPALNNHVLLRELRLDDNSISSLQELAACWLPIMQHLSVAQNRVTHLPRMSDFVCLENLDLHFNCLSDLNHVCLSLQRCRFLREVHLVGNPLTQERGWRSSLQKAVSSLRRSDEQGSVSLLSPPAGQHLRGSSDSFLTLCQLQLQQVHDLQQQLSRRLSGASSSLDAVYISCQHFSEALQLAEEHRLAHECGHILVCEPHDTAVPTIQRSSAEEPTELLPVDSPPGCWTSEKFSIEKLFDAVMTKPVMKPDASTFHSLATEKKTFSSKLELAHVSHHEDLRSVAAVMIQQWWRKRRQKSGNMYSPPTAEQGGVKGGGGQEPASGPVSVDGRAVSPDDAATVIQAAWRGFSLRRRLASALGAVAWPDAGHDDTFEEVDMDEFVFDKAALDKAWLLSPSEDSASTGRLESPQLLPMEPLVSRPGPPQDTRLPSMVQTPTQTWVTGDRLDSSPGTSNSDFNSKCPASASLVSGLSERSERIVEEWGFTDSHTAQLMLKRAQKMKPKKHQQQKLKDPSVRLALFRSCAHQLGPVEARHRPAPQNTYHVQVCEVELELPQPEKSDHERVSLQSRDDQGDGKTESEHFLPEISSNLLSGGRVQLMADPGHTQRLHHATSSSLSAQPGAGKRYPRRRSLGHEGKDPPSPKRVTSAPNTKERISLRDNPVQLSVGWGGGKKRGK